MAQLAATVPGATGTGHHPTVFPAQVGPQHLLNGAGGSGDYFDAESVEPVDGPWSHSTGDDYVGAQTVDEPLPPAMITLAPRPWMNRGIMPG